MDKNSEPSSADFAQPKKKGFFKGKFFKFGCLPLVIIFFILLLIGVISGTQETSNNSATVTSIKKNIEDSGIANLKREVSNSTNFDGSMYRETIDAVKLELSIFNDWAKLYEQHKNSTNEEAKKLAEQLRANIVNTQKKEFPSLRKAYAKACGDVLWEHDIYVTLSTDKIINLTGGYFAANKNIKETQESLILLLTQLRFKEVRYRWYKGADDFTYYKIESKNDSDI